MSDGTTVILIVSSANLSLRILAMAFARTRVLVQSATKTPSNGGVESRRSLFRLFVENRPRSLVFCIGPMRSQEHQGASRDSSRCPIGKASGWP